MHAASCETFWINSIPYNSDQLEGGSFCPQYTCILLYVKLILCRSIPYIYGQLDWGLFQSSGIPYING